MSCSVSSDEVRVMDGMVMGVGGGRWVGSKNSDGSYT